MSCIELFPDIYHCIETVARREYRDLVKGYLQSGEVSGDFEQKVELLRAFLETADFKKLRQESDCYLLNGKRIKFIIAQEQGKVRYTIVPV